MSQVKTPESAETIFTILRCNNNHLKISEIHLKEGKWLRQQLEKATQMNHENEFIVKVDKLATKIKSFDTNHEENAELSQELVYVAHEVSSKTTETTLKSKTLNTYGKFVIRLCSLKNS